MSNSTPSTIRSRVFVDAGAIALDAFSVQSDSRTLSQSGSRPSSPGESPNSKQCLLRFAKVCFESALALQPEQVQTMGRLVKVYLEFGDFPKAYEMSQQIIGESASVMNSCS